MASTRDPSASKPGEIFPETPSLETGLQALQQKNYTVAIAHLEAVTQLELDETQVTRAQMGLVTAYSYLGQKEKAIALCLLLDQNPDLKIRTWAAKTLVQLTANKAEPKVESKPIQLLPHAERATKWGKLPTWSGLATHDQQRLLLQVGLGFALFWALWVGLQNLALPVSGVLGTTPYLNSIGTAFADPIQSSFIAATLLLVGYPKLKNLLSQPPWVWGLVQLITAYCFVEWTSFVLRSALTLTNTLLAYLPIVHPINLFYQNPHSLILFTLGILFIALPWLMDEFLKRVCHSQSLPLTQLNHHSPETVKTLTHHQPKLPKPQLMLLPLQLPIIFTYGNLPRTARIVVSQGLLESLTDEEIASLYAAQFAQIRHKDFIVMSWAVLFLQIPYLIYRLSAKWGEQLTDALDRPIIAVPLKAIASLIANLSYQFYWLWRLPLLWLSRWRFLYSDAEAAAMLGNPNALIRADLKIASAYCELIKQARETPWLLDSFELLLPVGNRQALKFNIAVPTDKLLVQELENPYRYWLNLTQGHPLLSDRFQKLTHWCHYWRIQPQLNLPRTRPSLDFKALARLLANQILRNYQALPLGLSSLIYGIVLGVIARLLLGLIGAIAYLTYVGQLVWLSQNQDGDLITACILLSFSLVLLLRLNHYFPNPKTAKTNPSLTELYSQPQKFFPIRLDGKLLGRRGIANGLGQDLILQAPTGCIKLHYVSGLGILGDLGDYWVTPSQLIGRNVTVIGWFRTGTQTWIDLDCLFVTPARKSRSYALLMWGAIALVVGLWGAWLIWQT